MALVVTRNNYHIHFLKEMINNLKVWLLNSNYLSFEPLLLTNMIQNMLPLLNTIFMIIF